MQIYQENYLPGDRTIYNQLDRIHSGQTVTRTCHLVKLLVWTTRMPGVRPSKGA